MGFGLLQVGNIIIAMYVMIPKVINFNSQLLYAFIPLVSGVMLFSVLSIAFQPFQRKTTDAQGEVQNYIIESYNGKIDYKELSRRKIIFENFIHLSKHELRQFLYSAIVANSFYSLIRLTFGASLLWGAYLVKHLDMGAGSLIYFSGILFLIVEPLAFLSWIGVVFVSGYTGWRRVKDLADAAFGTETAKTSFEGKFYLEFWSKPIEIELNQRDWTVLVGETGCGKSYLLTAMADHLKSSGESISMVSQEPYLYNDTLGDNIFLGRSPSKEDLEHCKQLIKLFGLDVLASSVEEVLKMEVGENGKKVSGGQAKRICLLRSVFADVNYVIWDDPFSSVDLILEKQIIKQLKRLDSFKNKTIILSSHRLSTVKNCNKIVYLEKDFGIKEQSDVSVLETESLISEYFRKQLV